MRLQYFFPTSENPFWQAVILGMRTAAEAGGATLTLSSADDSEARQAAQMAEAVERPPDVVLVSPCGMREVRPQLTALAAADVPVVAVDQNLGPDVTASVISGNTSGGVALGVFVSEALSEPGTLIHLQAQADLQSVMIRRRNFLKSCQEGPPQELHTLEAGGSRSRAEEAMRRVCQEGPRFHAVFAENDVMALGAVDALRAAGYAPWPLIVGFDAIPEAIEALRAGTMQATVMQQPRHMGEAAAETALAIASGDEFEPVRAVRTELITAKNVDRYFPVAP